MRFRSLRVLAAVGFGIGALWLVHACSNDGSGRRKVRLEDSRGQPSATLESYDSLLVALDGAEPTSHYDFSVTPSGAATPILGQARLMTDGEGNIAPALLLIDVDPTEVPTGSYDVRVSGPNLDEVVAIEIESPTEPYIYSCDSTGEIKNSFSIGELIYAAGGNFPPNVEVHIAVMQDQPIYRDGDPVQGIFYVQGTNERVTRADTDANGNLPLTELHEIPPFVLEGEAFDLIADLPPYDVFDEGQDAADGHAVVGLTFQIPDVGTDVDTELACDRYGVYKDTFTTSEGVHARINPPIQYVVQHAFVDKYVVSHRDEWKDGDVLQDVSGGNEMDGVQSGCTNEYIVLVFAPPIPPGQYDVIIDVDQDGKYTQGTDIVDGGSAESFGKVGFTVQ